MSDPREHYYEPAEVTHARRLAEFAKQNLEDALKNVDLARLAAKAAEAELRAVESARPARR